MTGAEILQACKVEVSAETFTLVSLRPDEWLKLPEHPKLSPRMTAPFMIFRDNIENTLLLDEVDFVTIRHAVRDLKKRRVSGF